MYVDPNFEAETILLLDNPGDNIWLARSMTIDCIVRSYERYYSTNGRPRSGVEPHRS